MRSVRRLRTNIHNQTQIPKRKPWSYWTVPNNRKKHIYTIEKVNGFKRLDEWYKIDAASLNSDTSYIIRQFYNGSLHECLADAYPHYDWVPWKFTRQNAPSHHWEDPYNQHIKMNSVAKDLRVKTLNDWYDFGINDVIAHGGRCVLRCHNNSLHETLTAIFPDFTWTPTKFQHAPKHYWTLPRQQKLFKACAEPLGVKTMDDWYGTTHKAFKEVASDYILEMYGGSLQRVLQAVYPSYTWDTKRFHWQGLSSIRANFDQWTLFRTFLKVVRKKAGFTRPEMWYHVSFRHLTAFKSNAVTYWQLQRYWPRMLVTLEPNFDFEWKKFKWKGTASKPRFIVQALQVIFPMKELDHLS